MIAVRPPEYFPRLATVALMLRVDHFVIADTFQYSRQSFQNRSKLRNPDGWQWISIPLFGSPSGLLIQTVDVARKDRWRQQHWRAFMYNYRSTMYFEYYEDTFRPFFDVDWDLLANCTTRSMELTKEMLELDVTLRRASDLPGAPRTVDAITDALAEVRDDLEEPDAKTLLVPPDAAPHDAGATGETRVLHYDHPTYRQNFEGFEPGMSAMDVMFNYGPEATRIIDQGGRVEDW
jgi:hypothetical protein